jgi:hypothetical protein
MTRHTIDRIRRFMTSRENEPPRLNLPSGISGDAGPDEDDSDLADAVVAAWKTSNRVTPFLFENLPSELWPMTVPGRSRRTVRMIAGHIHNSRCMWIKTLGRRHGIRAPKSVNLYTVTRGRPAPSPLRRWAR